MKKNKPKIQDKKATKPKAKNYFTAKDRRHFIRHPLALPLVYTVIEKAKDKLPKELPAETVNVSIGGLLFPAKHAVLAGSMICLQMPFEGKIFNLKGKVVRCVKNPETRLYDIAVCFWRLREAFKAKMIEQIYLISEYRDLLSLQLGKEVSLEDASRKWVKRYSERFKRLYW